ncbi:FtsW/RodA/SpoVE family cell cycle protein [Helcobacillus sp. ACRRO]|uniref:FtsW/RodA/SpoVE family cell cycle protein n=1 Tax=Helcobacillus sp. ACRRO TaxID=2918202 RepID=UPI001EF5C892|nr:FtsW/RodA/SpoVE family cell cycle protein [Helcobacillus sp. ACRRO]MCG7427008.1 FtsW/RodA/SpoVE family cell cycle protein [Helcobacillus sp. ACRRO]
MATVVTYQARTRRLLLAALTVAALVLGAGALLMVDFGRRDEIQPETLWEIGIVSAVALVLAGVVAVRAPFADPLILPVTVLLNMVGLAEIRSVDLVYEEFTRWGHGFSSRQVMWTGIAMALALLVFFIVRDHRTMRRYTWITGAVGLAFLLLPLMPIIGSASYGARIWIRIGSYSFQPAEIAKIMFAIFFAGFLVSRRDTLALAGPRILGVTLPRWADFGPILGAWLCATAVLVFQNDLGTSLLFFGLFVVMLYTATDRLSWLIIGAAMFTPPALLSVTKLSHVQRRLECWLDPMSSANFANCGQINNGIYGLANGGLIGTGLGQGRQDLVPFAQSDYIFASLGEELGLIGVFALLMLYGILVQRGLRAAIGMPDGFGKLLAAGLAFSIGLQIFIVVGGVTRVVPLTGLTLPFMAAGGSSLVANWIIIALLIKLSDAARRPAARTLDKASAKKVEEATAA